VFDAAWPAWDEAMTQDRVVEVAVQVNGKTRGTIKVGRGALQDAVLLKAQKDDTVRRFTDGKEIKKVIFVKDRLLNIVVG
jgi:leucyl-tRNA synthetase